MIPQILKMSIVKSVSKLIRFNSNLSVNGHGFLVRLEGKVIKNASDYSPGVETRTKNTYIRSTSGNNELLLKLQAVEEERTRNKHRAANTFYKMSVASDATSISRIPTLYAQNDHGTIIPREESSQTLTPSDPHYNTNGEIVNGGNIEFVPLDKENLFDKLNIKQDLSSNRINFQANPLQFQLIGERTRIFGSA